MVTRYSMIMASCLKTIFARFNLPKVGNGYGRDKRSLSFLRILHFNPEYPHKNPNLNFVENHAIQKRFDTNI